MSQDPELSRHSEYFAARAVEERRMAMSARDEHVRAVHLEMADRYAQLAEGIGGAPSLQLVVGDPQEEQQQQQCG